MNRHADAVLQYTLEIHLKSPNYPQHRLALIFTSENTTKQVKNTKLFIQIIEMFIKWHPITLRRNCNSKIKELVNPQYTIRANEPKNAIQKTYLPI